RSGGGAPASGECPFAVGPGQSPSRDRRPAKTLRVAGAARHGQRGAERRRAEVTVDQTIAELAPIIGKRAACAALGRSRATYYRRHRQSRPVPREPRVSSAQTRALSQVERAEVLGVLHPEC